MGWIWCGGGMAETTCVNVASLRQETISSDAGSIRCSAASLTLSVRPGGPSRLLSTGPEEYRYQRAVVLWWRMADTIRRRYKPILYRTTCFRHFLRTFFLRNLAKLLILGPPICFFFSQPHFRNCHNSSFFLSPI